MSLEVILKMNVVITEKKKETPMPTVLGTMLKEEIKASEKFTNENPEKLFGEDFDAFAKEILYSDTIAGMFINQVAAIAAQPQECIGIQVDLAKLAAKDKIAGNVGKVVLKHTAALGHMLGMAYWCYQMGLKKAAKDVGTAKDLAQLDSIDQQMKEFLANPKNMPQNEESDSL